MFYGVFSLNTSAKEDTLLRRLEKVMSWKECVRYPVTYGNFSGALLLDPRLPTTIDDCLYINTSQDLLVLVSGYIYNREQICEESNLKAEHISNPALVAFLYSGEGEEFVQGLNGDFAIIIYQKSKNTIHLFRDHVGIGPLAYTIHENSLYFSSDCIGLCRTFYERGKINVNCLLSAFKSTDLTETPNERVVKLNPGHYLKFSSNSLQIKKYWQPESIKTDNTLTRAQVLSELKSLVIDAIHLRSDQRFQAAAHVSGGLDSGVVAALARREYSDQKTFYGYSWSSPDVSSEELEYDEREHVQKSCEMAAIKPVFIHLTLQDFIILSKNYLKNQGYLQEEKILDLASQRKINLIFSGWGGDEFISKGNRGIDSDLFFNFQWTEFFKRNPLTQPKNLLGTLAFKIFFPAFHILRPSVNNDFKKLTQYLKEPFKKINKESIKNFFFYRSRRALHLGMLYNYHLSERTETWYINGLTHGVEYRYPLLDKRIIEYMLKVPSKFLVKGEYARVILRENTEGLLPEEVRWKQSKFDPVFFSLMRANNAKAGKFFKNDLSTFKKNPHLHCFDFDLIAKDLKIYEQKEDTQALKVLYTDIFSIKLVHEFVKSYTEN